MSKRHFERHIKSTFQNHSPCSASSSTSENTIPNSIISISSFNTSASSTRRSLSNQLVSDSEVINNCTNTVISNKKVEPILNDYTLFHENSITNPLQNNKPILADKLKFIISKYHVLHHFVNELLTILHDTELDVPKDVRTLLRTPKSNSQNILSINPGTYIHFGIRNMPIIYKFFDELHNTSLLELGCNIDGLPEDFEKFKSMFLAYTSFIC